MRQFDSETTVIAEERIPISGSQQQSSDLSGSPSLRRPSFGFPNISKQDVINKIKQHRNMVMAVFIALVIGITATKMYLGRAHQTNQGFNAMPVNVQTVTEQKIHPWSEFSGKLEAVNFAEIRPEVKGTITEVRFEDGQTVKKGDVLFVIDPAPYKAIVSKAEADLATAKTNADFAKTEFDRAAKLIQTQAIAQRVYDERNNANHVAEAAVQAAQAALDQANVDFNRAYVKAPFSGRVGRPEVTVGNSVQDGSGAPVLTTIVSKGSIYADFEVDEQTYLDSIHDQASGRAQERTVPVEINVQGDKLRTYKGSIYSFDNHIDNVSGTIRARAKFTNEDGALVPGMYVSVRVGSSGDRSALLVPERAIGTDQNKKYVFVVGSDNKVAYRDVIPGKQVDSNRVIVSGLNAGDRVIVDGLQHLRPGMPVSPQEVSAGTNPAASTSNPGEQAAHK